MGSAQVAATGKAPAKPGARPAKTAAPRHGVAAAKTGIVVYTPKPKASGEGVPVLSTKLPFTGISLWLAMLVAAGLLAAGTALRRVTAQRVNA
jgi:hypothetical protein